MTRRPGRTALVALLVAIPVMAMLVTAVLVRTDHLTARQDFRLRYGDAADVVVTDLRPLADDVLPPGARSVRFSENWRLLRTAQGERAHVVVTDIPLNDPITAGIVRVVDGRVPRAADEVLLSSQTARDLGLDVGDPLVLERPQPASLTVVGIGERRAQLNDPVLVLGPGTRWTSWIAAEMPTELVDLRAAATDAEVRAAVQDIAGRGYGGYTDVTQAFETDDGASAVRWSWVIGAVVLTVISIVIAAAFAAGARRQLTTLGQLAANGASPRVLRRVLFLQGTWTGCIGTSAGLALGVGALALLRPHVDRIFGRDIGPWDIRISDLVPVVLLGIAAATIAALVPARSTSRVPVLAALSGRRPLGAVPHWLTGAGIVAMLGGLGLLGLAVLGSNQPGNSADAWALAAIVGGVAVLLGACAIAPGFVSVLEPVAGRLRSSWRLAARSLARQRTRTSAVVSAVCATCALAVAASALILGGNADASGDDPWIRDDVVVLQSTNYFPGSTEARPGTTARAPVPETSVTEAPDPALIDAIGAELPGTHPISLRVADGRGFARGWFPENFRSDDRPEQQPFEFNQRGSGIGIADEDLIAAYRLDDAARHALESTGVILLGSADGTVTIVQSHADGTTVRFDAAVVAPDDYGLGSLPRLLLTPAKAIELGFASIDGPVVIEVPGMTRDQREAVQDVVGEFIEDERLAMPVDDPTAIQLRTSADFSWPNEDIDPHALEAILGGVALIFALFVVGVSLALAAAETRDERDVLDVVGASPAVLRRTSGRKAVLLTLLGVALAIPVGFLPVVVFAGAREPNLPLVFPFRTVALLALVVPVVIGAITMVGSSVALRIRPVRISTMTFE